MIVDEMYSIPYTFEGIYDEIRDLVHSRDRILKQYNIFANKIRDVFQSSWDYTQDLMWQMAWQSQRKQHCQKIIELGVSGIGKIWYIKRLPEKSTMDFAIRSH